MLIRQVSRQEKEKRKEDFAFEILFENLEGFELDKLFMMTETGFLEDEYGDQLLKS